MWFLNKNNFISQNYQSFTESVVIGSGNILLKFELDPIIFLDFTGIESLKYKEIRVSGAKLFSRSIQAILSPNTYIPMTSPLVTDIRSPDAMEIVKSEFTSLAVNNILHFIQRFIHVDDIAY